jgi:CBS domain-containing protein
VAAFELFGNLTLLGILGILGAVRDRRLLGHGGGPWCSTQVARPYSNNYLSGVYYVCTQPGAETIDFHDGAVLGVPAIIREAIHEYRCADSPIQARPGRAHHRADRFGIRGRKADGRQEHRRAVGGGAGEVVGIVSERDYVRRLVLMARSAPDTPLRDLMSSPVMYVHPDQTSDACMALMTENRLRHLPVMDGDRLIGLISIGDLVKATISNQQFIIEQLEHYISGQRD